MITYYLLPLSKKYYDRLTNGCGNCSFVIFIIDTLRPDWYTATICKSAGEGYEIKAFADFGLEFYFGKWSS
jgi:hypothetical protein